MCTSFIKNYYLLCNKITTGSFFNYVWRRLFTIPAGQVRGVGKWGYLHSATTPPLADSKIDKLTDFVEKQWKHKKNRTQTLQFVCESCKYGASSTKKWPLNLLKSMLFSEMFDYRNIPCTNYLRQLSLYCTDIDLNWSLVILNNESVHYSLNCLVDLKR